MLRNISCILLFSVFGLTSFAQKTSPPATDSIAYYDDLFSEVDNFLDSLLAPRTMVLVNVGISNSFLNYTSEKNGGVETKRVLSLSPSIGYYHKGGVGINLTGMVVNNDGKLNPYQLLATASYDYLTANNFITGISLTKILEKKKLSFYTSPLQNEIGAYFTYRKWWIKPSFSAKYGWGSRSDVEERDEYITSLRLRSRGFTRVNTTETVSDFSTTVSVRHDFCKLDILGKRTVLRITPQLSFTSGTQKFGFNQTSNTYGVLRTGNTPILNSSEEVNLDDNLYFQPISTAAFLKTELTVGKFFVQPQIAFNYYFPATEKHFSSIITLNMGFIF